MIESVADLATRDYRWDSKRMAGNKSLSRFNSIRYQVRILDASNDSSGLLSFSAKEAVLGRLGIASGITTLDEL